MLCSKSEKEEEVHDTKSCSTLSLHEQNYTELSWKELINNIERGPNDAGPAVDSNRLTRFIKCSLKEACLHNLLETIDIDLHTTHP